MTNDTYTFTDEKRRLKAANLVCNLQSSWLSMALLFRLDKTGSGCPQVPVPHMDVVTPLLKKKVFLFTLQIFALKNRKTSPHKISLKATSLQRDLFGAKLKSIHVQVTLSGQSNQVAGTRRLVWTYSPKVLSLRDHTENCDLAKQLSRVFVN